MRLDRGGAGVPGGAEFPRDPVGRLPRMPATRRSRKHLRWPGRCALATLLIGSVLGGGQVLAHAEDVPPPADSTNSSACGGDGSCLLPFPSEHWLVPDDTTVTGVRVQPLAALPSELLDQLGPGGTVGDAYGGADGFSPLAPIVFGLDGDIDPRSIPGDGGELVGVWDSSTGERVPVRVEVSTYNPDERGARQILLVWPRSMFEFGAHLFAGVRNGVLATDRTPIVGSARVLPSAPETPEERVALAEELRLRRVALLARPEVPFDDYLAATSFVVRSETSITADVDRMVSIVRSQDHPIRGLQIAPSLFGGVATITGQVRTTDFRNAQGVIPRDGSAQGSARWIDFMMTMPERSSTQGGAPVVVYGHGITISKETQLVVAGENARRGLATVSIDIPNHGSRAYGDGYVLDLATPRDLGKLAAMVLQGPLDQLSLVLALEAHFGGLDMLPHDPFTGQSGDGIADLDPSRIYYVGTSMGGFLGLTFLALTPEVDAAFLQVGGSGVLDAIFHSALWELAFKRVVPYPADPAESHVLIAGAQSLLDRGDNSVYLERIRARGTPVFLVYAIDDGIVGNATSERTIELLDLPQVGATVRPVTPGTVSRRIEGFPASGTGFEQIPTGALAGNWLAPLLAHTSFLDPVPTASLNNWLDRFVVPGVSGEPAVGAGE